MLPHVKWPKSPVIPTPLVKIETPDDTPEKLLAMFEHDFELAKLVKLIPLAKDRDLIYETLKANFRNIRNIFYLLSEYAKDVEYINQKQFIKYC